MKNHSKTFGAELASAVADVRTKTSERKSASGPEYVPGEISICLWQLSAGQVS